MKKMKIHEGAELQVICRSDADVRGLLDALGDRFGFFGRSHAVSVMAMWRIEKNAGETFGHTVVCAVTDKGCRFRFLDESRPSITADELSMVIQQGE